MSLDLLQARSVSFTSRREAVSCFVQATKRLCRSRHFFLVAPENSAWSEAGKGRAPQPVHSILSALLARGD